MTSIVKANKARAATMKPESSMIDMYEKYKYDKTILTKSADWFVKEQAKIAKYRINPNRLISNDPHMQKKGIRVGRMYCFLYDAKTKDQLPYYDKFPLVFIWRATKTHFWGINLHYLPPYFRAKLLDALLSFRNNSKYNYSTKLKFNYQLLNGVAKYRFAKPAVKQYLFSQLRSPLAEIPAFDWFSALMIAPPRFTKSQDAVWMDSMKKFGW